MSMRFEPIDYIQYDAVKLQDRKQYQYEIAKGKQGYREITQHDEIPSSQLYIPFLRLFLASCVQSIMDARKRSGL